MWWKTDDLDKHGKRIYRFFTLVRAFRRAWDIKIAECSASSDEEFIKYYHIVKKL